MQDFARQAITMAALAAGLPEGRVIDIVKRDNLTIERPRVEIQFLPEKFARTWRQLAVHRTKKEQITTRELYEAELTVNANVLADDRDWLEAFSTNFVAALPHGGNDSRGNWVKISVQKATFSRQPDRRVGDDVIEVFVKVNRLFVLTFTGRVTAEEAQDLIQSMAIRPAFIPQKI